jgi:hypothetical protein
MLPIDGYCLNDIIMIVREPYATLLHPWPGTVDAANRSGWGTEVDVELTKSGEQTPPPPGGKARWRFPERLRRHPRLLWTAGVLLAAFALYWAFLRQAQTYELDSDPAGQALQAWAMWHGNPLLRGWWLGDVSFYTVELPVNVIIEMIYGLRVGEIHILVALVYVAVVLLSALLARGNTRGSEGVVRAVVAAGIMLAPSLVYGTRVLLHAPNHTGTMIPILLMLLLLDRAPERWWVPAAVGVMLTWAQVNDPIATYAAALAVAAACGVRICSAIAVRRRPRAVPWYDLWLAVAALVSIELAHLIVAKIHAVGGFYFPPPKYGTGFAPLSALPGHLWDLGYNVLILFGADFLQHQPAVNVFLGVLHLAGLALGVLGLCIGLRGFFTRVDRVTQIVVAGTVFILAAGALGTYMSPVTGAHEIIPVLPFCAVLAGRVLGGRLAVPRLRPVLALGLACYLGALVYNDVQPVATPWHQDLAGWLEAHNLRYGLAGYWEANITTLDSGGAVRLAAVQDGGVSADPYESDSAWVNPAVSQANFIVSVSWPASDVSLVQPGVVRARFGAPAHTYHFKEYTIMVYNYNLLTRLQVPAVGGF